jgi:hypothetical protein
MPRRIRSIVSQLRIRHIREHDAWRGMLARCRNPRHPSYKNYGGRGITACERWNSFENFLDDMGKRPSPKHSLDRIDNNGNYEPGNCRWATRREQANNTRMNRFVTFDGRTMTLAQWARETGIHVRGKTDLLHWRLQTAEA